ncbi:hypothetical protein V6N11_000309 [Hibiscus sabdariffa]|uniref:Uncharacterized protein n=1 Tax=Hibiscus sabdariffa TaxID=183260 RepID=A0ABR1ZC77_9ROSI
MLCSREIFKFLVRKDVRKILKRKDSDAGERGFPPLPLPNILVASDLHVTVKKDMPLANKLEGVFVRLS